MKRILACALLLLGPTLGSFADMAPADTRLGLRIDPGRTWVGLARVHLEVADLWVEGESLEGTYRIHVPLAPSRDDSGEIRLRASRPFDDVQAAGGLLAGSAYSTADGRTHGVTCRVLPEGIIHIDVSTEERTLSFTTRYRTIERR